MSAHPSIPKRPRLSLQIKTAPGPNVRLSKSMGPLDPKSPTAFNTLSNVYVTAIERSAPAHQQSEPLTAIMTSAMVADTPNDIFMSHLQRIPTPFTSAYPETPLTANPTSPAPHMEMTFPSVMTATPPLSAGPVEPAGSRMFTFSPVDTQAANSLKMLGLTDASPRSPRTSRRVPPGGGLVGQRAPYTHPRSLRSILRNSPLPPTSAKTPVSPRRQSLRLAEKAARRVGYNSPLTQTITTQTYTRSHIDLLAEEASPYSPYNAAEDPERGALDLATAYQGDETRDGGQTPGPFEEMRRRIASLDTDPRPRASSSLSISTSVASASGSPSDDAKSAGNSAGVNARAASGSNSASTTPNGVRKRKRRGDRKRQWVWTINEREDEDSGADPDRAGALAAIRRAIQESAGVTPLVAGAGGGGGGGGGEDEAMSDASSVVSVTRATTPGYDEGTNMRTPTVHNMCGVVAGPPTIMLPSTVGTLPTVLEVDMLVTPSTEQPHPFEDQMVETAAVADSNLQDRSRLSSVDLINPETGSRRDTPVPPDMLQAYYNEN